MFQRNSGWKASAHSGFGTLDSIVADTYRLDFRTVKVVNMSTHLTGGGIDIRARTSCSS